MAKTYLITMTESDIQKLIFEAVYRAITLHKEFNSQKKKEAESSFKEGVRADHSNITENLIHG